MELINLKILRSSLKEHYAPPNAYSVLPEVYNRNTNFLRARPSKIRMPDKQKSRNQG